MLNSGNNNYATRFEDVFTEHYNSVKRFAYAMLKSEDDAQDIAQNIFTKLWTNSSLWQGKSREDLGSYLFAMTKNATLNYIRHRKVATDYCDKEKVVVDELFFEDNALDPIYYEEAQLDILALLEKCRRQMPELTYEVFMARRIDKKSYKEIGEMFKLSETKVHFEIYRASRIFRQEFKDYNVFCLAVMMMTFMS